MNEIINSQLSLILISNSKKVSDFSESVVIQSDLFRVCVIPSVTVTDRQTEIGLT